MLLFDERILFCLAVLVWCIKEGTSQMPDHGPTGRTASRAALFCVGCFCCRRRLVVNSCARNPGLLTTPKQKN